MAQQIINVGNVANDGQGDPLRTAFIKTNDNFTELYNAGGISGIQNGTSNITIAEDSTINMAVAGVSDVLVVTDTGINVQGSVVGDNISTVGNVYSTYYYGNGTLLSGLSSQNANSLTGTTLAATVVNSSLTKVGTLNTLSVIGNINSGANILATSTVRAGNIVSDGSLAVAQGATFASSITAGGTISTSGNIVGNNIIGTFIFSSISTSSNIIGGNLLTSGVVSSSGITTGGNLSAGGNITGNYFIGNGSQLTGLPSGYSNTNVAAYLPTYTGALTGSTLSLSGNILSVLNTTSNITTSANILGSYILGNGSQLTGIVATGIGVLSSLSVTGNAVVGNLSTAGNVNAGLIYAAGLSLSGGMLSPLISSSDISTTANVLTGNLKVYGDTSVLGNISVDGNIDNAQSVSSTYFYGGAVEVENHVWVGASGNAIWTSGNVTGANVISTGSMSTVTVISTGNITGGNVLTAGIVSAGGTITGSGLRTSGTVSATSNVTGGNLITAGIVSAGGTITGSGVNTGGIVSAAGNIVSNGYFIGTFLGNITGNLVVPGANTQVLYNNNGNAGASAGFVFDSTSNTVSTETIYADNFYGTFIGNGSQLTGIVATVIGTVPSLSVTGNIDTGNLRTAGIVTATGNIVAGNINTGGLISATGEVTAANVISFGFYGNSVEVESHVWVGGTGNSIWTAGNITGTNIIGNTVVSSGIVSAAGNINTPADINSNTVNSFGFYGNSVEVESHVWVGNAGNSVWTAGNVTGNNIVSTGLIILNRLAADPPGVTGAIYFNTGNSKFRGYTGSSWVDLN
jgi:hypothetical protein